MVEDWIDEKTNGERNTCPGEGKTIKLTADRNSSCKRNPHTDCQSAGIGRGGSELATLL